VRERIAAIGEIAEDHYIDDGNRLLGGISANFARAAASVGARVTLFGAVGDDPRGTRLLERLRKSGLDAQVRVLPGRSACQRIRVAKNGERVFCGFEAGVVVDYVLLGTELEALAAYDAVALPCSPESRLVFEQCMSELPPKVWRIADFSQDTLAGDAEGWIEPHAERLRIAFVGGTRDFAEPLRALSKRVETLVVLTAGAAGAFAFAAGEAYHQPSLARTIVDTTGCGDAFQAAFTVRYLESRTIADALHSGAALAARVASRVGAAPD
jgi:sugar/nucleoside kinase (ribokinase family)